MRLTKAQEELKKSLIRAVHLSRRYTNYYKDDKEAYRELLEEHFGVKSSKELSISELIELNDYLNFRRGSLSHTRLMSKAQERLLKELWSEVARDKSQRALIWFLKRFEGELRISVDRYSKKSASKAILALKKTKGEIDGNK